MAYSPHSTPGRDSFYYSQGQYYEGDPQYASPSPTPSPRHSYTTTSVPHQRPATRSHFRTQSSSHTEFSPRQPTPSPRYTSSGQYATVNVSNSRHSRKHSSSGGAAKADHHHKRSSTERRNSYSYHRASDHYGESDEDEIFEINGVTYVLPAQSRRPRRFSRSGGGYYQTHAGLDTDEYTYYTQGGYTPTSSRDPAGFASPRWEQPEPARRSRRSSTSVPQRPQTARPASSSHHKKPSQSQSQASQQPSAQAAPRKATSEDAKKHRIPAGFSLKNWDPSEQPILLLGSVFDANALGKWIYDWTVYHHGAGTPVAEVAGDLWLLLIQISGKLKRSEDVMPRIRTVENREMIEDFIESGERITDKLRKLLKTCEAPMLKAAKKKDGTTQLGNNAGVEFVETLFGREREMERTEKFMQSVRLWNLRFDANCEEILLQPTA